MTKNKQIIALNIILVGITLLILIVINILFKLVPILYPLLAPFVILMFFPPAGVILAVYLYDKSRREFQQSFLSDNHNLTFKSILSLVFGSKKRSLFSARVYLLLSCSISFTLYHYARTNFSPALVSSFESGSLAIMRDIYDRQEEYNYESSFVVNKSFLIEFQDSIYAVQHSNIIDKFFIEVRSLGNEGFYTVSFPKNEKYWYADYHSYCMDTLGMIHIDNNGSLIESYSSCESLPVSERFSDLFGSHIGSMDSISTEE